MEVSGRLHALAASPIPTGLGLSEPQRLSERYGEKKNLAFVGNRTLAFQPAAVSTVLSWLSYLLENIIS
jgi:hypothetical protein